MVVGSRFGIVSHDEQWIQSSPAIYDPGFYGLMERLIDGSDVVFDLGANVGLTSLIFSELASQVVAMEPNPAVFSRLQRNLDYFNVPNVQALPYAVGESSNSHLDLFWAPGDTMSGSTLPNNHLPIPSHTSTKVPVLSLDQLAKSYGCPNFIKLDIEGSELRALRSGLSVALAGQPTCFLELNHFCLNVLHEISLPLFLRELASIFPSLLAVDISKREVVEIGELGLANRFSVMYEHVVNGSFPALVGTWDLATRKKVIEGFATSPFRGLRRGLRRAAASFFATV